MESDDCVIQGQGPVMTISSFGRARFTVPKGQRHEIAKPSANFGARHELKDCGRESRGDRARLQRGAHPGAGAPPGPPSAVRSAAHRGRRRLRGWDLPGGAGLPRRPAGQRLPPPLKPRQRGRDPHRGRCGDRAAGHHPGRGPRVRPARVRDHDQPAPPGPRGRRLRRARLRRPERLLVLVRAG